ncbi:bifunctional WD40 repeat/WD40-YVTN repeat-like-containing domain superfamily/G-protein beta WD-40 repeat/WD repeat Prp46-PLRG1-like/WD40-repeat-containing domain superfamily/WD40 repeat [Babesia duncani]|uniref:Bifunctional WD40 repeat/WD40-YVTN repeat-like-containing domain superfamily/G-protein beta WD-40 repeat/WD repeat Prp46-PLRG1-like/WD40-repeat-containing domain superfamily/WD40 repeat n=1 Tax=Babesia duncani TaxID=323732 RepID=A0AAD9PKE3_9APIC|nr:bifunctional WD40 repeat/WD40-YVTN repeat-like-containing domain superfamily/G-protein beta WD-40 repeat/WD repeat Prp46-PLRG1-like/WD40-repeat-containing domain superfamily/WD40 repeat [Babesia duncani]
MADETPLSQYSCKELLHENIYNALNLFAGEFGSKPYYPKDMFTKKHVATKVISEYSSILNYTPKTTAKSQLVDNSNKSEAPKITCRKAKSALAEVVDSINDKLLEQNVKKNTLPFLGYGSSNESLLGIANKPSALAIGDVNHNGPTSNMSIVTGDSPMKSYIRETLSAGHEIAELNIQPKLETIQHGKPKWNPPWKLYRVIAGHHGWVHTVAVDVSNEWFATGGGDRLIKIWDLATCQLKLSLTGHINAVRDIKISERHPYLFSCAEDNTVKCWDIEQNKVVRNYHGHLSGVYCLALHPALDVLFSAGRDAVVRVWDIRTKQSVHVLSGHSGTIMSIASQAAEPQIISGSQDKTVRLWDLAAGKSMVTLTNHKKSIRAIAIHPTDYVFCSCAADNVKVWTCPQGVFNRNITGHNSILNCCAIKDDGYSSILVAGSNNGQLHFWDWNSGYKFQTLESTVQKGSLESENGIFACTFDRSESRLITAECDKTIKIWIQDDNATPETHPIEWVPQVSYKNY